MGLISEQEESLLTEVILKKFREEKRSLFGTSLLPDDHRKPLAYLAAKAFANVQEYRKWLVEQQNELNWQMPISILLEEEESARVRSLLFNHLLARTGVPGQMAMEFGQEAH